MAGPDSLLRPNSGSDVRSQNVWGLGRPPEAPTPNPKVNPEAPNPSTLSPKPKP